MIDMANVRVERVHPDFRQWPGHGRIEALVWAEGENGEWDLVGAFASHLEGYEDPGVVWFIGGDGDGWKVANSWDDFAVPPLPAPACVKTTIVPASLRKQPDGTDAIAIVWRHVSNALLVPSATILLVDGDLFAESVNGRFRLGQFVPQHHEPRPSEN